MMGSGEGARQVLGLAASPPVGKLRTMGLKLEAGDLSYAVSEGGGSIGTNKQKKMSLFFR